MAFEIDEIIETVRMIESERLDIRTVTLAVDVQDCAHSNPKTVGRNLRKKLLRIGKRLIPETEKIESRFGIPVINRRVSVTPISRVLLSDRKQDFVLVARALDDIAGELGVDFVGGFSAMVHKQATPNERGLIESIPTAVGSTQRLCSAVNVATTKAGINMDAVLLMGRVIRDLAYRTRKAQSIGPAKLVIFANIPEDNPFMAGATVGWGEGEATVNVGVSGPGVVRSVVAKKKGADLGVLAEEIKKTAFKITRMGELIGQEVSRALGVRFGIVDLSLAPTPLVGDSIANILEEMGLESCGAPGTTAALALLNDAVKKGGAFASSRVGGLSGAFIPYSEDAGMVAAARRGSLTIEKLEAMTSVCSVGLDMVILPGDTPEETLAGIIADECAIGIANNKTTGCRLIPVHGAAPGDRVNFGGLLGSGVVMDVSRFSSADFVRRGGLIPAPLSALTN
jgi:uncharacterized protein (UPF0210 family)